MKNDPTLSSKPTGPDYWRSLDELTGSPEFQQWAEREFPETVLDAPDGSSRRDFMKIMGASFYWEGWALTGCRRPEEALVPFPKCLTTTPTVWHNILRPPCRFGILRFRSQSNPAMAVLPRLKVIRTYPKAGGYRYFCTSLLAQPLRSGSFASHS